MHTCMCWRQRGQGQHAQGGADTHTRCGGVWCGVAECDCERVHVNVHVRILWSYSYLCQCAYHKCVCPFVVVRVQHVQQHMTVR